MKPQAWKHLDLNMDTDDSGLVAGILNMSADKS